MTLPIRVYWARRWLFLMTGTVLIALVVIIGRFFDEWIVQSHHDGLPVAVQGLCWIGLFLLGWGGIRLIRKLAHPRLMFEISDEGLTTFYDRNRFDYVPPGYLISWSNIEEIKWVERTALGANNAVVKQRRIELILRNEDRVPVEQISLYLDENSPKTVAIDATTGSLNGRKLFGLLQQIWENKRLKA